MASTRWYGLKELAGLPGVPGTVRGVQQKADREKWRSRPRKGRGGGKEYAISSLPEQTRSSLRQLAVVEGRHKGVASTAKKARTKRSGVLRDTTRIAIAIEELEQTIEEGEQVLERQKQLLKNLKDVVAGSYSSSKANAD